MNPERLGLAFVVVLFFAMLVQLEVGSWSLNFCITADSISCWKVIVVKKLKLDEAKPVVSAGVS